MLSFGKIVTQDLRILLTITEGKLYEIFLHRSEKEYLIIYEQFYRKKRGKKRGYQCKSIFENSGLEGAYRSKKN